LLQPGLTNASACPPPSHLAQAISFLADTSNSRETTSNIKWDAPMKTSNRDRQRKWKQKQVSNGMRTVTVMLPVEIKDLIDQKRKESGKTIAHIIETAVVNMLAAPQVAPQSIMKTESNRRVEELPAEELHQIGDDLKAIVHRFENLATSNSAVSGNKKTVTNNGSDEFERQNSLSKEIYRLVRLLNNMEVSPDEIAVTLNKRKFKTLSGNTEWKLEDVHEVLKDIHQKYGHINPLFSITGNP
jgi:predicted transcriptional regulator